jgi:hypothetical protein
MEHFACPGLRSVTPPMKGSIGVLSPRLVRNSKSRQRLLEPLLAGFEILLASFWNGLRETSCGIQRSRSFLQWVSDLLHLWENIWY